MDNKDQVISDLEDTLYRVRRAHFVDRTLPLEEYFPKISCLRKQYFELTGKEFIPAMYQDD